MRAQELQVPANIVAGSSFSIAVNGDGDATFYLFGPGAAAKRSVHPGSAIEVTAEEVRASGRYLAVLCGDTCRSTAFYVAPAEPASIAGSIGRTQGVMTVAMPAMKTINMEGVCINRRLIYQIHTAGLLPQ